MMRAVTTREPGDPSVLELGEVDRPEYGDDELLVRVHATALNRADLMQRQGRYPPPEGASPLLGLELAGTVEEAGARARERIGDRVFGLLPGGGYAEYAVIHRDLAMQMPASMSFAECAAVPEVFLTAFQALHWLGRVSDGDVVLIHAGASGVGTAAIQLARTAGCTVLVTASAGKHAVCRDLGADTAIDYRRETFVERVAQVTEGRGADVVVDFIGGPYFADNVRCLATDGRLILLATLGGGRVEELDLRLLFRKRASVVASTLRNRDLAYKISLTQHFQEHTLPLLDQGAVRPVIDRVMSWREAAAAHRLMEANENAGKIVLTID